MFASEVIIELTELDHLHAEWDELAVASKLPLMAPACVLAWWRHLAPATAEPRMVAVKDGARLVGFAPFYVDRAARGGRSGLRLPGTALGGRLAPLAASGQEQPVAAALAAALAGSSRCPDLVAFEAMPLAGDWAELIRATWPARRHPASRRYHASGCPTVSLHAGSFEEWLKSKSSSFRADMRKLRRQFAAAGGSTRLSTPETLRADVEVLMRLHDSRWQERGGSKLVGLGAGLPALIDDLGEALLHEEGRFRLRLCEVAGEPISAQLDLAAGGVVQGVVAGWDERFFKLKPSTLGVLAVIEDALERGDERFDLGLGEQAYKLRFADGNDPVAWTILIPAGAQLPLTLLRTAPMRARATLQSALKRRLSEKQVIRLRRISRRLGARTL